MGDNFEIEYFGESKSTRKHRLSFLDTLLLAMDKDKTIDMEGCCEEVDTFMFEGNDFKFKGHDLCQRSRPFRNYLKDTIQHQQQ